MDDDGGGSLDPESYPTPDDAIPGESEKNASFAKCLAINTRTREVGNEDPPYPVLTKRTEEVPNWLPVVTSVGAVLMAFIISGIILKLIGADPIKVYRYFFKASFGSWGAFSDVLVKATPPLILIGLGCALAFRMRLWNIGAEGQFFIGALWQPRS